MRQTFSIRLITPGRTYEISDLSEQFYVESRLSKPGRFWLKLTDEDKEVVGRVGVEFPGFQGPDGTFEAGKIDDVLSLLGPDNFPHMRWEFRRLTKDNGFQLVNSGPLNVVRTRQDGNFNWMELQGTDWVGELNKRIIDHEVLLNADAADMVRQLLTTYIPEYGDLQSDAIPTGPTSWPGVTAATGIVDDWEFRAVTLGEAIETLARITKSDFWQGADVTDFDGAGIIAPGGMDFYFDDYAKFMGDRFGGPNTVTYTPDPADPDADGLLERNGTEAEQKRDRGLNTAMGVGCHDIAPGHVDKFRGNGVQHEFALSYEPRLTDATTYEVETTVPSDTPEELWTDNDALETIHPVRRDAPEPKFRGYNVGAVDDDGDIGLRLASIGPSAGTAADHVLSRGLRQVEGAGDLESLADDVAFLRYQADCAQLFAQTGIGIGATVDVSAPEFEVKPGRVRHPKAFEITPQATEVLSANRTITIDEPTNLAFDPNGANRQINLPTGASSARAGKHHLICNADPDPEGPHLTIQEGGTELATLKPGDVALVLSASTSGDWKVGSVSGATKQIGIPPVHTVVYPMDVQHRWLFGTRNPNFIEGFRPVFTSYSAISVSPGVASAVFGQVGFPVVSSASMPIDITASGAGGLDTGVEAASTWYAIHVIGDSTGTNPTNAMLSLSPTAPTLPAGYDMFRRVGWVRNDPSSNIIPFIVFGEDNSRIVRWLNSISFRNILSGGAATVVTLVSAAAFVPPTTRNCHLLAYNFGTTLAILVDAASTGPGLFDPFIDAVNAEREQDISDFPTDAAQNVAYQNSGAGGSLSLYIMGYKEHI